MADPAETTGPGDLASVLARVQRLEDVEAARGLLNAYATVLDDPDPATVTALFAEDGELHTPVGTFAGHERIARFYTKAFRYDPSLKRHFVVAPRVVGVADRLVTLTSDFLYTGVGETSKIGWGRYDDVVDASCDPPVLRSKRITMHVDTDLATGWAQPTPEPTPRPDEERA